MLFTESTPGVVYSWPFSPVGHANKSFISNSREIERLIFIGILRTTLCCDHSFPCLREKCNSVPLSTIGDDKVESESVLCTIERNPSSSQCTTVLHSCAECSGRACKVTHNEPEVNKADQHDFPPAGHWLGVFDL